jgi:hypothetical protein
VQDLRDALPVGVGRPDLVRLGYGWQITHAGEGIAGQPTTGKVRVWLVTVTGAAARPPR